MTRTKLLVLVMMAACGKKGGGGGAAAVSVTKADADAANAAVPAELKNKVNFDVRTLDDGMKHHPKKFTFVAPAQWKKGFMPGSVEPNDGDNMGFGTTMEVGTNCDGSCEPKDWAAVVDKVYYSQYTSGKVTGKIIKDEKGKNDRLMVFANEPTVQENAGSASMTVNGVTTTTTVTATSGSKGVTIIHTWWADGDKQHYVCQATLNDAAAALAPAFEKACARVSVEE